MNDPHIDKEELATSGGLLAKRLRSLARAAERRAAPVDFREALGRAVGALETGVDNLFGELTKGEPRGELAPLPERIAKHIVDGWSAATAAPTAETVAVDAANERDGPSESSAESVEFENAPLTGSCDVFPIADLIEWLGVLGKTGVLVVQADAERFTVEFHRGRVVHASSDQAPAGDRLGDILIELRFITAEELSLVLERARASGEVLGTALERSNRLSRVQLETALAAQVQRLFGRLYGARRAIFAFRQGELGRGDARVSLSPRHLLMESARLADELAERLAVESLANEGSTVDGSGAARGSGACDGASAAGEASVAIDELGPALPDAANGAEAGEPADAADRALGAERSSSARPPIQT